VNLYTFV